MLPTEVALMSAIKTRIDNRCVALSILIAMSLLGMKK